MPNDFQRKMDAILAALDGKKADNVAQYDVRGKSSVTDAPVVASATSVPHLRALSVAVQRAVRETCGEGARVSGDEESAWIVLDYFDVMVHLFLPDARAYSDIEALWRSKG